MTMMSLRETREANNIRLEDMARTLGLTMHDLTAIEMASTRYHKILNDYMVLSSSENPAK